MPRLSATQWEKARAEYEVCGTSIKRLAAQFRVDRAAVSRRAKNEGWEQGKKQHLVEGMLNARRVLSEIEAKSHTLPVTFQRAIDAAVWERLKAEGFRLGVVNAILIENGVSPLRTPRQ